MPTVQEVLRDSGFTDEQIAAMDQKAVAAFGGVLTNATKQLTEAKVAQDAAELAQRSNVDFYENRIAPSLVQWEEEKQRLENDRARVAAEAAFYRTQAEEAKKTGFIPGDAPGFDASKFTPPANGNGQNRDSQGRYVSGVPGATPGSPTFDLNQFAARAGDAMGLIADIQWEHQHLFGKPLPISPTQLIAQADAVKLDPKTYASRTFNFDARRQEIQKQEQEAHDQKVRDEGAAPWKQKFEEAVEEGKKNVADTDKKWAERLGSNPDVRMPMQSPRMTDVARGVKAGEIPDPLMLNDQQRRAQTRQMIRTDIDANVNA